jgi:crotonobetainyl-CoA:carnitine CoA-transferase CaiB-like acyl-CoA transferase
MHPSSDPAVTTDRPRPLSQVRVVDLTTGVAGPMATKLLAGFGASVLKVEPPGGDPTRGWDPPGWFPYLNTGKSSLVLDPTGSKADAAKLRDLVESADVVVDDHVPAWHESVGLDLAAVRERRPDLVVVSVTPYGLDGPFAGRKASALTLFAAGGAMWLTGEPDREPVKNWGPQAEYEAGFHAFAAAVAAITGLRLHGTGRHVDISIQETVASMLEVNGPNGFNHHRESYRAGNVLRAGWGVYPCKDGYIGIHALPNNFAAMFTAIGRPDLIETYNDPSARSKDNDLLEAILYAWCGERTAKEIFEIGQRERAPFAYLPRLPELLAWPGLEARGYWAEVDDSATGRLRHPGAPFRMWKGSYRVDPAPPLG